MFLWIILGSLTVLYSASIWIFLLGLGKLREGQNIGTPSVSVVVAARNEEQNIRICLESLLAQNYAGAFDITVADDQSTDGTAEVVEQLAEEYPNLQLIKIQETPKGWAPKKHALNQAIGNSTGEIILATDADCILPTTWIEGLVRMFEPPVGIVVGYVQIDPSARKMSLWVKLQALELLSLFIAAAGGMMSRLIFSAMGGSLAYRRETFRQIDGFERIKHLVSGDDDLLLQQFVSRTDWDVRFSTDPGTFVTTKPMPTLRAFFRQRRRWASKALHQRPATLCFLLVSFLLSISLMLSVPLTLLLDLRIAPPLICLAIKVLSEFALLWRGANLFGRMNLLGMFPLWELAHIPYVVLSGLAGLRGELNWKGRQYARQDQIKKERDV